MGGNNNKKGGAAPKRTRKEIAEEKKIVKKRLDSGEYCTVERAGGSMTGNKFVTICLATAKKDPTGFVMCKKCSSIFSLCPGSGTTHLIRHTQKCECDGNEGRSGQEKKKAEKTAKPTLPQTKAKLTKKIVEMCGRDLRPYNIVKGRGFRKVLQECVNIGAELGGVDVDLILPHPSTIARNVAEVADEIRNNFLPEVKNCLQKMACAMDADMWTDKYVKGHYLTVTSQYISDDWDLKSNVLITTEFPTEEKKTGENIRKEIKENLSVLDIHIDDFDKLVFVSDQGANMKLALAPYKRLACVAHLLATVLRHLLDEDKFLKAKCPTILAAMKSCRNVINYLKATGCCKLLDKSVKTMVLTRWNTVVDMLQSMCESFEGVVKILIDKNEFHRLDGWDALLVTELVHFLMPFKEVTVELQAKKVPTLHLVLVKYHELLNHCEIDEADSEEIKSIKDRCKSLLNEKIILDEMHFVATFLCPNLRLLLPLSEEDRHITHAAVRKLLAELPGETSGRPSGEGPSQPKKSRFGNWCQMDVESTQSSASDEVDMYINLGKPTSEDPALFLKWWKHNQSTYPKLARLARSLLAVPATSASSERNFSRAGLLLTEKRAFLDPGAINDLLVIHSYFLGLDQESKETDVSDCECMDSTDHIVSHDEDDH